MAETKSTHGEYTINGPKKRAIFRISSQTIDLRGRGSMILTHTYLSSEVGGEAQEWVNLFDITHVSTINLKLVNFPNQNCGPKSEIQEQLGQITRPNPSKH